ncbi:uncharacterized protein LOC111597670 isoform X2 [Drosophila hydei]|uniref:non-specific serine/threonine protein kinase n=1 Tax=Drosophila hydei TaxID=7224 RepID=A0A6J1LLK4_DROHY|nr:uncharacterized protein LOC111597670 isoform X2 [Drosophila hydei]
MNGKNLKNFARPNRSIKRVSKKKKEKSQRVVYVTWKRGKHKMGSLIKGRYFVEAKLDNEAAWLGWDLRKKRACTLKAKNACRIYNRIKGEKQKRISNEEGEIRPVNHKHLTKLQMKGVMIQDSLNSDNDRGSISALSSALEAEQIVRKEETWDVTKGGLKILPMSRSGSNKRKAKPTSASCVENTPAGNESWDITQGGLNILPMQRAVVPKTKKRSKSRQNIRKSETGKSPKIPNTESWGEILPIPHGVCSQAKMKEITNWIFAENEYGSERACGTAIEIPFDTQETDDEGESECESDAVAQCDFSYTRSVTPSRNPMGTPRWNISESISHDITNQICRSPLVSDAPSWYITRRGKRSATVKIGDLLNERYYILTNITISYLASVWLCWDLEDKCNVVMKMSDTTQMSVLLIQGEISTISAMHAYQPTDPRLDCIVKVLDAFQLTRSRTAQPCIILEALESNLAKYASNWHNCILPLDIVKYITRRVLEGLDYIHSVGVVHADIKPENVLITPCTPDNCENCPDKQLACSRLHVKIADFANSCGSSGKLAGEIQTRAYRCLESILGSDCERPADIWSVACMVFELAVGDLLFGECDDDRYTPEEDHLARIIELLGPIPHQIIFRGRDALRDFNPYGKLRNITDLRPRGLVDVLMDYNWSQLNAMAFASFLTPMLDYEPKKRATAAKCLQHPWLQ